MDSKQLIDSLTAHIALYHSSSSLSTSQSQPPSANPRASILRWFASLTVHQRQSYLTIVDAKFTEILLQMQRKIRQNGHGFFIILPDLPSRDRPSLPSLCFRKSRGLLARASASDELERSVSRAVRMFGSREGERVEECSCSVSVIDTVTVSEEFVRDLDRFVEVMDRVSNGGFLRGEDAALGSSWEELPWLKAKGYYSMEAFVANKLELALRLAWLNCNGGKKKGAKLKEKTSAAGVAANVYWRKKGCLDWWTGLDLSVRKKVLRMSLGKAAKSLTNEILKGENSTLDDDAWLYRSEQPLICNTNLSWRKPILKLSGNDAEFGMAVIHAPVCRKPTYSVNILNSLVILQGISAMILSFPDSECEEKLFFSTLDSVCTISDSISRKLRGLLMFVSLDCTKLELLGEGNPSQKKSKEKTGVINRKRKAKNRNKNKLKSSCISSATGFSVPKPLEEQGCQIPYREDADVMEANGTASMLEGKDLHGELLSGVEMEHAKGLVNRKDAKGLVDRKDSKELVDGKVQNFGKKSKKEDIRRKKSGLKGSSAIEHSGTEIFQATTHFATCHSEVAESSCLADASTVLPNAISYAGETENLTRNSSSCNSTNELNMENDTKVVRNFGRDSAVGTVEDNCHIGSGCSHLLNREVRSQIVTSGKETRGRTLNPYIASPVKPETEFDDLPSNMEHRNQTSLPLSDSTSESKALKVEATETKEENLQNLKKKSGNYYTYGPCSSGCTSYEWPSVAPVHFPSVNSQHLPVATDRLHLEVGYDWRHQFHQSFVSTGHQGINHSMEGSGCSRIMSMPMSLDWPPMVRSVSRLTPSLTFNYDSGFIPRVQSSYRHGLTAQGLQLNGTTIEDEKKYYGDLMDSCDLTNTPEPTDESESHWISEEEFEVHAFSGRDYNQYFGGGVMYWNVSDHPGTGFSRPPSLSSEDSSWAWQEAELNRTVDDMVNGLTSPPAAPFCSPFDSLGPGHQTLGYVLPGNDVSGKVLHSSSTVTDVGSEDNVSGSFSNPSGSLIEGQNGDSLPYPILRPIIVPKMSRKGSRSEFKLSNGHKSPCIPPSRREQPRIKRAPSPVMLCAPRAPRPPPPSPVGESRKQRGFPTVRSGSSSPRHWGMRNWFLDGKNSDEARLCVDGPEVIWPSWRNKSLSATTMIQPLPDALLQDHLIAMSQLALEHEHPDVALPLQPPDLLSCPAHKMALPLMHGLLHDEIDSFCKQVAVENFIRKPYVNWAVKRVARSLQVLWPRSRTNVFGSNATGLALPTSDVDLVVSLPPVRNLEPIKEAGILEGRNGIKETCLQHAARYLANQEWVKNDSVKTVENTAIPIIMLMAEVHPDLISSTGDASDVQTPNEKSTQMIGEHCAVIHTDTVGSESSSLPKCSKMRTENAMDVKSIRLDISFKSSSHTGLQTTELVKELTEQFPAATPLALVLKKFLADRSLDQSYSGGLSSYCLVLLITRFLQHEHHLGRPINQNLGSLLMDFLYFFGNVFDPRQMRISVQGSGVYLNRERGYSIDPIHIDDPLFPTNNIGRNCFRIHQCIKAFADAYSALENELTCFSSSGDSCTRPPYRLLPRIIPSIDHVKNGG